MHKYSGFCSHNSKDPVAKGRAFQALARRGRLREVQELEAQSNIADVVAVLTDSLQRAGYFDDMRRRDAELVKGGGVNLSPPFRSRLEHLEVLLHLPGGRE